MIRQISSTVLAAALFLPAMPALASDTTGQPGRGGDGHCPIKELATDPDCAREGVQWRGTGRIGSDDEQASSRDEYPRCRNWRAGQPRPAGCRRSTALVATSEADKRNQFPTGRPRQPRHLG